MASSMQDVVPTPRCVEVCPSCHKAVMSWQQKCLDTRRSSGMAPIVVTHDGECDRLYIANYYNYEWLNRAGWMDQLKLRYNTYGRELHERPVEACVCGACLTDSSAAATT